MVAMIVQQGSVPLHILPQNPQDCLAHLLLPSVVLTCGEGQHGDRQRQGLCNRSLGVLMAGYRLGSRGVSPKKKVAEESARSNGEHDPAIIGHEK